MYYFFHSTNPESFKNILKTDYITASFFLNESQKKYIRMSPNSKYVFTNIFVDDLPLKNNEYAGLGRITFIIDPIILKYKQCYFNKGWLGYVNENSILMNNNVDYVNENSILMNNNVDYVLEYLKKNYSYPYILSHEALFRKNISFKFVIGIICSDNDKIIVKKYLKKYGYDDLKIFNKFPILNN